MGNTREAFTSPLGRIVQGDVFEAQTKDGQGNLRVFKSGPNVGQPNPQFFCAVAFPKKVIVNGVEQDNHEFNAFYALLDRVARAEWPTLFPNPGQPCVNPMFTFKVKDGDGIDRNGKRNDSKEGFAGCWVVSFSSAYAPKVVRPLIAQPVNPQDWETLEWVQGAKKPVKCGDYVRIAGSATGNDSPNTPGLYVNLDMVELLGIGEAIVNGPATADRFGGANAAPVALPAGVQSAVGPATGAATAAAGAFAAPPPPGTTAAPPPAAPAPSGPVMLPAAGATTYEAYRAAGWSDEQLIAAGYMQAPAAAPAAPPAGNAPPPPAGAVSPSPAGASPATASPPPYDGYMAGPGNGASTAAPPPPGTSAAPATPSPSRAMTAAAGGATYESFIAQGWTDEQLIANGYMAS